MLQKVKALQSTLLGIYIVTFESHKVERKNKRIYLYKLRQTHTPLPSSKTIYTNQNKSCE